VNYMILNVLDAGDKVPNDPRVVRDCDA